ncbi:MAG: phosphomannomutase/phosphoglucomutase [Acidobacteriota bacterium]
MDSFRSCDIRGCFPDEIDDGLFYQVGRKIARKLLDGAAILVGCDVRPSSPVLTEALIAGLADEGARVFDAGRVPTPVIYFGRSRLPVGAAAIVTASHNPPSYNGLKLLLGRYPATPEQIQALKPSSPVANGQSRRGTVEQVDLSSAYVDDIVLRWRGRLQQLHTEPSFRLVVDPGNGAWTLLADPIFRELGLDVTIIHPEPDGRFPHRSPDCAAPGSLKALCRSVCHSGADLGLAWDGDGDRLAICDEAGRVLSSDQVAMLLIPDILKETTDQKVVYDVKMSEKVETAIKTAGGIPVLERSAHCAIEKTMIDQDCLFGCEYSGHFFFKELSGADDGMHAALLAAEFCMKTGKPLSDQLARLPRLFITPDIRLPGSAGELSAIECSIAQKMRVTRIDRLDGVKIYSQGGWLLVRPSVSENKLTFRLEGRTAQELQDMIDMLKGMLPDHDAAITNCLLAGSPPDSWKPSKP